MAKMILNGIEYNTGGGSGDSNNGYYQETELYSASSASSALNLNDSYLNYDALIFLNRNNSQAYLLDSIVSTTGIQAAADAGCGFRIHCGSDSAYIFGTVISDTQFSVSAQTYWVKTVIGINYTKIKPKTLIPKMTSATTPSGTVSASSNAGANFLPYFAFDGQNGIYQQLYYTWLPQSGETTSWIMYEFDNNKIFNQLRIRCLGSSATRTVNFTVEGRVGNTFENCLKTGTTIACEFPNSSYHNYTFDLNNKQYDAIRLTSDSQMFASGSYACGIDVVQVMGIDA